MKLVLSFIVLVALLFSGIVILIKPSLFLLMPYVPNPLEGRLIPKEIIFTGSILTITGLVGLSVLGFKTFNDSEYKEQEQSRNT